MFAVVFYDYNHDETIVQQEFETELSANIWVDDCMYEDRDIDIDEDGYDFWRTFTKYYNPEDKESYFGYDIREIKPK